MKTRLLFLVLACFFLILTSVQAYYPASDASCLNLATDSGNHYRPSEASCRDYWYAGRGDELFNIWCRTADSLGCSVLGPEWCGSYPVSNFVDVQSGGSCGQMRIQCFTYKGKGTECAAGEASCPGGTALKSESSKPPVSCDGSGHCNLLTDDNLRLFCKETNCLNGLDDNKDGKIDAADQYCDQAAQDASCRSAGSQSGTIEGICCTDRDIYSESFDSYSFQPVKLVTTVRNVPLDLEGNLTIFQHTGTSINASLDSTSHSGKKSLKIILNGVDGDVRSRTIDLPAGSYNLSAYIKVQGLTLLNGDAALSGKIMTLFIDTTEDVRPISQTQVSDKITPVGVPTNFNWRKIEFSFAVPEGKKIHILFGSNWGQSTGTLWVDDVKITRNGNYASLGEIKNTDDKKSYVCTAENGQWRWMSMDESAFIIMSTGGFNDIISNGNKWFLCKPGSFNLEKNEFNGTSLPPYEPTYGITGEPLTPVIPTRTEDFFSGNVEGAVTTEGFSSGLSEVTIAPVTYTAPSSFVFSAQNPKIHRFEKLKIKIGNVPTGYLIRNDTNLEIKVKSGNTYHSTNHAVVQSQNNQIDYFNITIPSDLEKGLHDLNITIMSSPSSIYGTITWPNAFEIVDELVIPPEKATDVSTERFLCYNSGTSTQIFGSILECCGSNYMNCINTDLNRVRISGGPTASVKDYPLTAAGNSFMRVLFPEIRSGQTVDQGTELGYILHAYDVVDLMRTDFSNYNSLEFDLIARGSGNLRVMISSNKNNIRGSVLFDDLVLKYSVSGTELNKWHHISIPLNEQLKSGKIEAIRFYAVQSELFDELGYPGEDVVRRINIDGKVDAYGNPIPYLMVFGIDRFFLSNADTQYCRTDLETVNSVGKWTNDLDTERDACNNVASYKWTSDITSPTDGKQTYCCGDDQSKKINENFYNSNAGCWKGMYVANNSLVNVSVKMPIVCGNGIKESPEECDDGNKASGDGCNKDCLMQSFDTSCANGMLDFYPDPDNSATPYEPLICADFCKHTNFIAGGIGNMMIKHNIFQVIFQYPPYSLYTSLPAFQNGLYLGYGTPDGQNTGAMHCRCYNLKEAGESCSSGTCNAAGVCV